jgi:hypothetical protein
MFATNLLHAVEVSQDVMVFGCQSSGKKYCLSLIISFWNRRHYISPRRWLTTLSTSSFPLRLSSNKRDFYTKLSTPVPKHHAIKASRFPGCKSLRNYYCQNLLSHESPIFTISVIRRWWIISPQYLWLVLSDGDESYNLNICNQRFQTVWRHKS